MLSDTQKRLTIIEGCNTPHLSCYGSSVLSRWRQIGNPFLSDPIPTFSMYSLSFHVSDSSNKKLLTIEP